MSFAILRHNKIKSTTKGVTISHNHRLSDEAKINIDKARSHLNTYFGGHGAIDRIDAKVPKKHRKDAVIAVEILLTSGPEFFDDMEVDREKLSANSKFKAWVQDSIGWAKKEFGTNLVDAVLHMDESTPHIHILAVPLTLDGRLCAKEVTSRPEMQRRQSDYAQVMKRFGLDRGVPATETKRRHIGLKEAAGSGGKASQEAVLLAKAQADLVKMEKGYARQQALNVANFHLINKIEAEAKIMEKALVTATERDHQLVAEITALRAQNEDAQASLEQLRAINRVIVDQARERLAREAQVVQVALQAAQEAQEAFSVKWKDARAWDEKVAAEGGLVDSCGNQAVYHLGRGVYMLRTLKQGEVASQLAQTEQEKKGLGR